MEGSVGMQNRLPHQSLEEKEKQIYLLQEEKNRLEQELSNLRGKLFSSDSAKKSGGMNNYTI